MSTTLTIFTLSSSHCFETVNQNWYASSQCGTCRIRLSNAMAYTPIPCLLSLVCISLITMKLSAATESSMGVRKSEQLNETKQNKTSLLDAYPTWESFAVRFMPVAFYVDRYVTLVYYIIGFPGNILSFIVWSRRRVYKGNSAAVYLCALSLNDLVVLGFAFFRDLSRSWDVHTSMTPGTCEFLNTMTPAVQYASPMFVLAFTVERWLAICRPFAMDRICSARRAIYICIVIILGTTILCCGNAFIFYTKPDGCDKYTYESILVNIYLALLELIFSGIVPISVLLFNCLVIREMSRVHKANRRLAIISDRLTASSTRNDASGKSGFPFCQCCFPWGADNAIRNSTASWRASDVSTCAPRTLESASLNQSFKHNLATSDSEHRRSDNRFLLNGSRSVSSERQFRRCSQSPRSSDSRNSPSFRSTTFMLLVVSFYMIVTTLLGGLMYLLHQTPKTPDMGLTEDEIVKDPVWNYYITIRTIKAFGDEIALSYYAFGFIIYYATGPSFRQHINYLLRKLLIRCGFRCNTLRKSHQSDEFNLVSSTRRNPRRRSMFEEKHYINPKGNREVCDVPRIVCSSAKLSTSSRLPMVNESQDTNSDECARRVRQDERQTDQIKTTESGKTNFYPVLKSELYEDLKHMDSESDVVVA